MIKKFKVNLLILGLFVVGFLFAIVSCKKQDMVDSSIDEIANGIEESKALELCTEDLVLLSSDNALLGAMSISNDEDSVYIVFKTEDDWLLKETYLFVGGDSIKFSDLPVNNGGNPKVGHFPFKKSHENVKEYTYVVPIFGIPHECMLVSAKAELINLSTSQEEGAWAEGINFPGGNWAMYSVYCFRDCMEEEDMVLSEVNFVEFISPVEQSFEENISFVDEFIYLYERDELDEATMRGMLDVLNISEETNVDELDYLNNINGTYDLIDQQSQLKGLPGTGPGTGGSGTGSGVPSEYCEKLVKVRNAMLGECDHYIWGVDQYCKAAVMIAYWWKSRDC